jgi:NADPH:quinone reductase-like Zn-dependent oxidoreductase
MNSATTDMGIIARAPGGPDVLEWTEFETARPGPREVLVAHRAIGVNFIDTYFRTGVYPWPQTPLTLGGEAAAVVEALGAEVTALGAHAIGTVGSEDKARIARSRNGARSARRYCRRPRAGKVMMRDRRACHRR